MKATPILSIQSARLSKHSVRLQVPASGEQTKRKRLNLALKISLAKKSTRDYTEQVGR